MRGFCVARRGLRRSRPVCTVLTWAKPRDLSHYETFEHYHATFYKHVEAQSVTPFSPSSMMRVASEETNSRSWLTKISVPG